MAKNLFFLLNIFFIYLFFPNFSLADIQKDLINKLTEAKTLSFDFKQQISNEEETGSCSIKYPLLMKCNYENLKQKTIISNGKTVAIIKKKYKKIYYYPLKTTPLFTILDKEKIYKLVRNSSPTRIDSKIIEFQFIDENSNILKIFFDKNSLQLKGWETKDSYSNNVSFKINNLKINNIIEDIFFKIPNEKDL